MKFKYTILYVQDVAKTLGFYQTCFGCSVKMLHESGDYAELETGDTVLAFAAMELIEQLGKSPKPADAKAPVFEIAFEADNVAGALETAVKGGAELVQSPTEMPWGQTISYVTDLNGFLVEICSPVST